MINKLHSIKFNEANAEWIAQDYENSIKYWGLNINYGTI